MPEGIDSGYTIGVRWEGGMRYRGGPEGGPTLLLDGERDAAPSPVDSLLVAIASCAAIDVVEILQKRRTPPTKMEVFADFARAADPPRRITRVRLRFRVATASDRVHVERAVALSFEKYCSVVHSLAADIEIGHEIEMLEPEA
jgi:putative redox protein